MVPATVTPFLLALFALGVAEELATEEEEVATELTEVTTASPHRRFEYKYSFKGPHLVQEDGTVPFWLHTGNAIPGADRIRITPSLKSQKGSLWTKSKSTFGFWELEIAFRITGRGRLGADGLAVWFTEEQGLDGPVFGAADQWKGVGIFFDSFDNDGKKNNPSVSVIPNDGRLAYDHQNDGSTQASASCQRDFRNKPYPVRLKITYYQQTLTVLINNGFTPDRDDYEFCLRVTDIVLPSTGYFGISAATGGLADDHDVLSFLTFRLSEPGKELPTLDTEIPGNEREKYREEFERFRQDLERKKEEFQKEHPDIQGQPDELFESGTEQELRQILEGQNRLRLEIRRLAQRLDAIQEEQKRSLAELSEEVMRIGNASPAPEGRVSQQEMEKVGKNQEEIIRQVNELRNSVMEFLSRLGEARHPDSVAGASETTARLDDLREHLRLVKRDVERVIQQNMPPNEKTKRSDSPSCLSTAYFFGFVAAQTALLIAYGAYRTQQEAAAKKFF
ncbi:protein ERGIC-53 isoform 2-T2 [Rhynochetos jubatus]